MFLPVASTTFGPSVVRHRINNDTDLCLCLEPCGLLLQFAHRVTLFSHRQGSACPECAARVITNISNYDSGLSWTLHHDLHWLDVTELYTSVCTAWLQRTWLNCVCPSLRQQVVVVGFGPPQPATSRLSTNSVACPVCWNSLPDYLKSSDLSFNCFRQQLKTFLFRKY